MTPASTPPISPGPAVTATASRSARREPAAFQRGRGHEIQPLGMGACGDLRDDATERAMERVLALHDRCEDHAHRLARPGAHHGDGGVVAAALDPEDDTVALHPL